MVGSIPGYYRHEIDELTENNGTDYKSVLKCPQCGSRDLNLEEFSNSIKSFSQKNGVVRFSFSNPSKPLQPYRVICSCLKCEHTWKARNVQGVLLDVLESI